MPMPPLLRPRGLLLAATLFLASLRCFGLDLSMTPGSASMPPKPLEAPLPPGGRNFKPIRLGAWVDETGRVIRVEGIHDASSTEPQTSKVDDSNPSVKALLKWRFEPVLWEGKPIPFRADVLFAIIQGGVGYSMNPLPNFPVENHAEGEFGLVMPSLTVDPEIQIPLEEICSRGTLDSAFRFVIGTDGIPCELEILGASSSAALDAALNALSGQLYKPGTIDGKPVRVAYKQIVRVSSTSPIPAGLTGLREAGDPIFPYDQLIAGESGSAKVKFHLTPDGSVQNVEVLESSHENFGLSLKACVASWIFKADDAREQPEREYTHEFSVDTLPGGVDRLSKLLRKGGTISSSSANLSGKPTRVASGGLCFPPEMLEQPGDGSAKIEFIIDRCGLAQLPRIVEASHPAFGWAAANWVGSMRFKPLLRSGEPTDLRIVVPISFKHPKPSTPPADKADAAPAAAPGTPAGS